MTRTILVGLTAFAMIACESGSAKEVSRVDGASSVVADTATRSSGGTVARLVASSHTLSAGTRVEATTQSALSSRINNPGETLRASVNGDVTDARGNVVIPAGSGVMLTVEQLEPGSTQIRPEGRLALSVQAVTVHGRTYDVSATLSAVPHHLEGRGITTDEAARVGGGTAIGALVGQAIGKNTKSTEIGGAVGAIAGTAVAVRYAYRDVIVPAGTVIVFTLKQSLNVSAR